MNQQVKEEDSPRLPTTALTAAISTDVAVAAVSSVIPSAVCTSVSPSGQKMPERLRLLRQPAGARPSVTAPSAPQSFGSGVGSQPLRWRVRLEVGRGAAN